MSTERSFVVRIPHDTADEVRRLRSSAAAALERYHRAPIGDRVDAVRYEHIQTAINQIAYAELDRVLAGKPSASLSDIEVEVSWPFAVGPTMTGQEQPAAKPVAQIFRSELADPKGWEIAEERFGRQIKRWVDPDEHGEHDPLEAVNPSEIPNRALSETLRAFFASVPGKDPVEVPVVYRDGSPARALRLRSLNLTEAPPTDGRQVLKVTLLSVRHMEMDPDVDGAWLRNREISLRRTTGQTDELVYQQSQAQLDALTADAPIELHMYQTGLPPANVGFYRAVADHHLDQRGYPVVVVPQYFEGSNGFSPGTAWVVAS